MQLHHEADRLDTFSRPSYTGSLYQASCRRETIMQVRPVGLIVLLTLSLSVIGVPVVGVQKTTIRTFTVNDGEANEGLHPHIRWTKTPDFVNVYRGISPMNGVFFPTSVVCLVRPTQA